MDTALISPTSSAFLLFLLLLLSFTPKPCSSDPRSTEAALICSNQTAPTSQRQTFVANFLAALDSVTPQVALQGYGSSVNGTTNATIVYTYGECMKDLSLTDCNLCFSQIKTRIQICLPFQSLTRAGRLFFDGCYLRYDEYPFYGDVVDAEDKTVCNGSDYGGNQTVFKEIALELMKNLSLVAVNNSGFADGELSRGNASVYGLVQCWEAVNMTGCNVCLNDAVSRIVSCSPKDEGRVLNAGCYLRYSTQKFYNNSDGPPPNGTKGKGSRLFKSCNNLNSLMALLSQQLQRSLITRINSSAGFFKTDKKNITVSKDKSRSCSAIAIDAPTSLTGVTGIRWGSTKLQGLRDEMEDDLVVVQPESLDGLFSFAAVFDGHGGFASVQFLREELHKECIAALQGGLLLYDKDFNTIKKALMESFDNVDKKLSIRLEMKGEEDESGATATALFIRNDMLLIAHVGDSSAVLSRSGKPEVLTNPHRPYGSNKVSLEEVRRVREAGGWIVNGRICGDIAVSRAFGDIRFKTQKKEMLKKGVEEGRWSQKFISRVQIKGDLLTASPDVFQVALGSDAEFVLLASDGLWDYINSSEAVSFVRNQLRQHGNVQLACEALAKAALDRRSQDNISVVIADLGKTDWQNLPVERENVVFELGQALATLGLVSFGLWISSQLTV